MSMLDAGHRWTREGRRNFRVVHRSRENGWSGSPTLKSRTISPHPTSPLGLTKRGNLFLAVAEVGGNRPLQFQAPGSDELSTSFDPKRNAAWRRMRQRTISSQHRVSFDGRRAMKSGYRRACVCFRAFSVASVCHALYATSTFEALWLFLSRSICTS